MDGSMMLESTIISDTIKQQERVASIKVQKRMSSLDDTSFIQCDDRQPKPDDNFRFRIDKLRTSFTRVSIDKVKIEVQSLIGRHLGCFLDEQIPAVKHVLNLIDISNLSSLVSEEPAKIERPQHILLSIQEAKVSLISLQDHKPVCQLYLFETQLGVKLQKRQSDMNVEVNFQVFDILAVDRCTPELDYFIE